MNNGLVIEKVILDNFTSYEEGEIDLNKGITVLFGERNGSGKTTFAEAISRVLTGKYVSGVYDNDKIRHGSDQFLITIKGKYLGESIEINCRRTKKRSNIQVVRENETISGKEAEEFLNNIVTNDEFKRLVYINGADIDVLIQGTPKSRSKVLDRILGIQNLITVIDGLKTRPRSNKIAEYSLQLDQKMNEKENLERLSKEMTTKEEIQKSIDITMERKNTLENELKELKERIDPLMDNKKKFLIAKKRIERIQKRIDGVKGKVDQLDEERKGLEDMLDKIELAISQKIRKDGDITQFLKNKDRIIEDSNKKIEEIRSKSSDDMYSMVREKIIDESLDLCPVCENEIDPDHIETIRTRISNEGLLDQRRIKGLEKRRDNAFKEKQGLEEYISRKEKIDDRLIQKKKQIVRIESELNDEQSKFDEIDIPEEWDNEVYEDLNLQKVMKEGQIKEIEDTLHNLRIRLDETEESNQRLDTLEIIKEEIEDLRIAIRSENYKLSKIREYKNGLKSILTNVRREMVNQINPLIQRWLEKFMQTEGEDVPYISYKLSVVEKTTAKQHSVRYEDVSMRYGVPIKFEALSTGQRAMCSLALILAIEDVSFHNIELMIFDEIHTSGIDDFGLTEILEILVRLVERTQILFIERRKDVIEYLKESATEKDIPFDLYNVISENGISSVIKEVD